MIRPLKYVHGKSVFLPREQISGGKVNVVGVANITAAGQLRGLVCNLGVLQVATCMDQSIPFLGYSLI